MTRGLDRSCEPIHAAVLELFGRAPHRALGLSTHLATVILMAAAMAFTVQDILFLHRRRQRMDVS
jgi:hypothetical protein